MTSPVRDYHRNSGIHHEMKTSEEQDHHDHATLGKQQQHHHHHHHVLVPDFARELVPYAAALLLMIGLFVATTIVYLHTTSAPALRLSAEKYHVQYLREEVAQLEAAIADKYNYSEPENYAFSSPRQGMCFFRSKLARRGMPTIHSIFADPVSGNIVIIGVRFQNTDWRGDKFLCEFEDGELGVLADSVVNDDRSFGFKPQYVFVATCPMPAHLRDRSNFTMSFLRRVNGTFSDEFSYTQITICPSGSANRQRRMLTMCTMLKDADDFIPDWIAFHRFVGVDHIFIYDNQLEELSKLRETVAKEIESGLVTVIPWAHNASACKNYLEVQIAHENDCLWRNRHGTKWMIKTDVDEYVQPMNPTKPRITDYLNDPLFDRMGAVRLQNWFFGRPNLSEPMGGQSMIERNVWRSPDPTAPNTAHDKNIIRPINVHYFKIHALKLGGNAVTLNPWTELRLVHYRADNARKLNFKLPGFDVPDSSMIDIMEKIAKKRERTKL